MEDPLDPPELDEATEESAPSDTPDSPEAAAQMLMDCGAESPEDFLAKAEEYGFEFTGGPGQGPKEEPEDSSETDELLAKPFNDKPDAIMLLAKKRNGAAGKAMKKHGY
jgi:hypothetical protein